MSDYIDRFIENEYVPNDKFLLSKIAESRDVGRIQKVHDIASRKGWKTIAGACESRLYRLRQQDPPDRYPDYGDRLDV